MKTFAHTRPIRDDSGNIVGEKLSPARRVTVAPLGGAFGADKKHALVVALKAGDVIEFRPAGTQRTVAMLAVDLYRHVLRSEANKVALEKARTRKAAVAARKLAEKIRREDRRLTAEARKERTQ